LMLLALAHAPATIAFRAANPFPGLNPVKATRLNRGHVVLDAVDPTWFAHVVNGLADADSISAATGAVVPAVEAVPAAAAADDGWFGAFVNLIEKAIELCDTALGGNDKYGACIVLFTLFVKALTYPLTYAQLSSTTKMQAIQPKIKAIQAKYQSNPEVMNREMSAVYAENNVNPLAGCLPSIVQIPVFIGLYRALLKLANDGLLNEPFLWLPNLEGPVYGSQSSEWLFQNWVDGTPSLGWHDTLAFLSLPLILIVTQSISQKLLQPPPNPDMDESQAASQAVLQYLPIMFGFFALNVPSGLGVYWVTNSLVSTASTLIIKNQVKAEMEAAGLSVPAPSAAPKAPASFSSMVDTAPASRNVVDVEMVTPDLDQGVIAESPLRDVEGFGAPAGDSGDPFAPPKKKGKKKKKKGGKK
jgi:YidC/Oxa1 family membrane protein insertase